MSVPDTIRTLNPDALALFRTRRRNEATAPRGPASFFWGDYVRQADSIVEGAPGRWSPLPDGAAGLRVHSAASEGIRIGGELVDGSAVLHWRSEDGPTVAEFPDGAEGVVFSYDGSTFALQVWNPLSEWARRFDDIASFDADPSWLVEASVTPVAPGRTVAITHHRDPRPVDVPVVAELAFEHDGREYTLVATGGAPGMAGLFVHFRDLTSGEESYSAGRSIRVVPDGDRAVLDFNYATLLPCSFSLAWNCPLPPAENTLPVAIRAGERNAVDREGRPLL